MQKASDYLNANFLMINEIMDIPKKKCWNGE